MSSPNTKPLVGDPRRKANATIAAFDYQLWQTLLAWTRLGENEVLYVEGAEDYDIVEGQAAYATQVKASHAPLSMASDEIAKAINDFWTLVEMNPDHVIQYIFISQAGVACERARQKDNQEPLLRVWMRGARPENETAAIVSQIVAHPTCKESLARFLREASPEEIRSKLIRRVVWEMESLNSDDCRRRVDDALTMLGEKFGVYPREAKAFSSQLYQRVMLAARSKNAAPLSRRDLLEAFEETTQTTVSRAVLNALLQGVLGSSAATSKVRDSVREWRKGPPPLPGIHAKRILAISNLVQQVQKQSIIFLHGSTGIGKTTLANMAVRSITGNWLWWSGRGLGAEEIRNSLRHLRFAIEESWKKAGVVLDDLDLSPSSARQYEVELVDLAEEAMRAGLMVIVTCPRTPPQSMLGLMEAEPQVWKAPSFSEEDVVETALILGCPDSNAIRKLSTLLIGGCRGHPQLIHAHLQILKQEGWINITPQRFVALSGEASEPAKEAASLIAALPDSQRQLLWRLSIIRCPFTRKHALRLAEFPPPAAEPGLHFDSLCGPWIESLHDGYFRVSPLLDQMGSKILSPGIVRQLHNAISVILWQNNLKDFEATSAFYHAWEAQDGRGLAIICTGLAYQKPEALEVLGWGMMWFLGKGLARDEQLFQDNKLVSIAIRIFQFRIAASVAPPIAKVIYERLEEELHKMPANESRGPISQMIAILPWLSSAITVSPKAMLRCLGRLLEGEAMEAFDAKEELRSLPQFATTVSKLVPMTMAWCNDIEQLCQWVVALDQAEATVREAWLGIMSGEEHGLHSMVEKAWLHESDKTDPNWIRVIEVLMELDSLGAKYNSAAVRIAAATAQAIVFYDYLNDPEQAALVLQSEHLRNLDNPFVLDRIARLEAAQGKHESAIRNLRCALNVSEGGQRETASRRGFMAVQAAVSAGKIGKLDESRDFLELAAQQFKTSRLWDTLIGVEADLGFVCYRLGGYPLALSHWTFSLTLIQKRIVKASGLQEFAIRKAAGHIITWVFGNVCSIRGSDLFEPPVGFASNLNPKSNFRDLPENDWDALWIQLIAIGDELQCPVEFADSIMPRLLEHPNLLVRAIAWMTEIHRCLANGRTVDLPEKLFQYAEVVAMTKRTLAPQNVAEFECDHEAFGYAPYLVALLEAVASKKSLPELLMGWRNSAERTPWNQGLRPWFEIVSQMFGKKVDSLFSILETGDPTWDQRAVIALLVCTSSEVSPRQLAIAQYHLLISCSSDTVWRRRSRDFLIPLFCRGCQRLFQSPALLSNPRINIPKLQFAMISSEKGYRKAAEIVIATIEVCGLSSTTQVLDQLRALQE